MEQAISSSYHHQSNGQVEACIKFVKCTLKKCFDSRSDPHIALLQIQMMPLGQGLPSPATMLTNQPIRDMMPVINRLPVGPDNEEEHHKVLIDRQSRNDIGSAVSVQWVDVGPWTHGKIEVIGDHNHHNRSYKIHFTKTEKNGYMQQTTHKTINNFCRTLSPRPVMQTNQVRPTRQHTCTTRETTIYIQHHQQHREWTKQ